MIDIYEVILNDPVYITIAVLLAISVVFSLIKKLFKLAVIIIAVCVLYVGYLHYTGEKIPTTTDELLKDVNKKTKGLVDDIRDKSGDIIKKADKLIKDKTP